MAEEVDLDLLRNCTLLTINQFPWTAPTVNDTALIEEMNKDHLYDLLVAMIYVYRERFLEADSIK